MVTLVGAVSQEHIPEGHRRRRCYYLGGYNAQDARRILNKQNFVVQPVAFRGSLLPSIPFAYYLSTNNTFQCNVSCHNFMYSATLGTLHLRHPRIPRYRRNNR